MVLPFDPMTMTFRDLHYYVPIPKVLVAHACMQPFVRSHLSVQHLVTKVKTGTPCAVQLPLGNQLLHHAWQAVVAACCYIVTDAA